MVNINYMLSTTVSYFQSKFKKNIGQIREEELYQDIDDQRLRFCLAAFQKSFNELLIFYNSKAQNSGHFNAEQSRELLSIIEQYEDLKFGLSATKSAFKLVESYEQALKIIEKTLEPSGGSTIPSEYQILNILKHDPIIVLDDQIEVERNVQKKTFSLSLLAEGSYARVYKFEDEFYDQVYALKRAKKTLTSTELSRFKKEFDFMKSMDSPYILKVFTYNDEKNEFIMEYVKYTLESYIKKNNPFMTYQEKKRLVLQIINAFQYIHSKSIFHRDISLSNILVKVHDDQTKIIKVCDFGYLKDKESTLTRQATEFVGSLNDPHLKIIGVDRYNVQHEIYALTQVIVYTMTGKSNFQQIKNESIKSFLTLGTDPQLSKRIKNLNELKIKFLETKWDD